MVLLPFFDCSSCRAINALHSNQAPIFHVYSLCLVKLVIKEPEIFQINHNNNNYYYYCSLVRPHEFISQTSFLQRDTKHLERILWLSSLIGTGFKGLSYEIWWIASRPTQDPYAIQVPTASTILVRHQFRTACLPTCINTPRSFFSYLPGALTVS